MLAQRCWTAWVRWPEPETGPYHIGITWAAKGNGRAEFNGFEVWRCTSARPSSAPIDLLTEVHPPRALTITLIRAAALFRLIQSTRAQGVAILAGEAAQDAAEGLKPSRGSRYPIEHYREVAAVYVSAPVGDRYYALRQQWPASQGTLAHWVRRARAMGLLGPS